MKRQKLSVWLIAILLPAISAVGETVYYVSPGGSDAYNGQSWSTALKTMETAVGKLQPNVETTIYVQENATINIGLLNLLEDKKVSIIGRNTVFLAHERSGHDTPQGEGNRILRAGLRCDLKVKGITFKNGRQVDYFPGGAIFFMGGLLEVDSCKFIGNDAGSAGGAIAARGRTVIVRNSYFEENGMPWGWGQAGAIAAVGLQDFSVTDCSLTVENCTFYNNRLRAGGSATAIGFLWNVPAGQTAITSNVSVATIVNCTFVQNTSTDPYMAAIDVSGGPVDMKTYLVNNTFYKNDGALRIGQMYEPGEIVLINNVVLAEKAAVFAANGGGVADGRDPMKGYNNIFTGLEGGVNQWVDDPCFNADKTLYNNVVATTSAYPFSNVGLATSLTPADVPYLAITSATSPLVNGGLDNSTGAIGYNLVPSVDARGASTLGVKDIGAFEWNPSSSIGRIAAGTDGFRILQTRDGVLVTLVSGKEALLSVYDIVGRRVYGAPVQQSAYIAKNALPQGIAVFTLDADGQRFVKKVLVD